MKQKQFQAVVWKEGRHFVSQCLNFDISSFGTTKKKALENLSEAVELYLEQSKKPSPSKISQTSVETFTLSYA